jgi:hypothetical protein
MRASFRSVALSGMFGTFVLGFAVETAWGQFTFDTGQTISIIDRPDGIAAGDWDGNDTVDLAVASDNPDKVSIVFNTGSATFGGPIELLTGGGTGPGFVIARDFDSDTDLDLAVALNNVNSVLILQNNGAGTFSSAGSFAVGVDPRYIAAGLLNADAVLDLAVVNRDGNSVSILLGDGDATFSSGGSFAVGNDPRAITASDFDGDLIPDLAVTNHDDRTIGVYINDGSASFSGPTVLSVGSQLRPEGIAAGDLDGDEDMDLTVATSGNGLNFASVFTNSGGVFSAPFNYPVAGTNPGRLLLSDLDCDEDLDIVTLDEDSANTSVLPNLGDGTFGAATLVPAGTTPEHAVAADFDGDLDPDLAISNRDSNDVLIRINESCTGGGAFCGDGTCDPGEDECNCPEDCGAPPASETGLCNDGMDNDCDTLTDCADSDCSTAPNCEAGGFTFDSATNLLVGDRPAAVATGDFDGDTWPDAAVTSDNPDKVSLLFNDGTGNLGVSVDVLLGAGVGADALVSTDIDGDLDLDLAVVLKNINSVQMLLNTAGTFSLGDFFVVGAEPVHMVAGHVNGDTLPDLAVVNRTGNSVSILINTGGGTFAPAVTVPVGLEPREVTAGDWDGDLDIDLAVTNHNDRTLSILTNDGNGVFTETATPSVDAAVRPEGITNADFDGDNDRDLAVTTSTEGLNFISVMTNTGGAFNAPVDYPVGGINPGSIVAVDLDCDGDADVATANKDSGDVSILPNNGGVFGPSSELAVGLTPEHLAIADFDATGGIDLIVANRDSDDVSLLYNMSCVILADGDADEDGDSDLWDFTAFQACFSGPETAPGFVPPSAACQEDFDFNGDQDVDLGDWTALNGLFAGPL